MNKDITSRRNLLIKALKEFPEDRHIKGELKSAEGFCASGLACDVYIQNSPAQDASWGVGKNYNGFQIGNVVYFFHPSPQVCNFFQIEFGKVLILNDEKGLTFKEIADSISKGELNI